MLHVVKLLYLINKSAMYKPLVNHTVFRNSSIFLCVIVFHNITCEIIIKKMMISLTNSSLTERLIISTTNVVKIRRTFVDIRGLGLVLLEG